VWRRRMPKATTVSPAPICPLWSYGRSSPSADRTSAASSLGQIHIKSKFNYTRKSLNCKKRNILNQRKFSVPGKKVEKRFKTLSAFGK
jgi:hypothetical protein